MDLPIRYGSRLAPDFEEPLPIHVIANDWFAPVPAIHHIVYRPFVFNTQNASHEHQVRQARHSFNGKVAPLFQWLQANRERLGDRNGLHLRLDVSYNDDRCRVQSDTGMLLLRAYRRLANSLFMEWRNHQPNARHLTTIRFQTVMAENHRTQALRFVLSSI